MARTARVVVLAAVLLLAAGGSHAQPAVTVQFNNYQDDTTLAGSSLTPPTTTSGLELVQSVNGSGTFFGRILNNSTASDTSSLLVYNKDAAGWSDSFEISATMTGEAVNGVSGSVHLLNKVTDTQMENYVWLADTNGVNVYKIDTTKTGSAAVVGAYASRPSAAAGNPVAFTVLSNGDAMVGNAFTFQANQVGSITKIQADATTCGTGGAATTPGATSTGFSDIKGWPSTVTGTVYDTSGAPAGTGLIGAYSDNQDECVKAWNALDDDGYPNLFSVAAVAADGYDNTYTIAVNEATRFQGQIKIYRSDANDGSVTTVLGPYSDPNQVVGTPSNSSNTDGPGAPGGSGLVIDKWGYLWSGGGTYLKDTGAGSRKYIVIRMDTSNPGTIQYFYVDHETQALALDNDSNLLVSGAGGLTILQIDPKTIGSTWAPDSVGTSTVISPGAAPIDLIALQGGATTACQVNGDLDNCCAGGNYNTGISVSRSTGDIYVANECLQGYVLHLDKTGAQVGSAISVGTYPSAIQVDPTDTIWLSVLETTGSGAGESRTTNLITIAPGAGNSVNTIVNLAVSFLGGTGDATGRYTAQPPSAGTWTWIHDTWYPGYDKWDGASAQFVGTNLTIANPTGLFSNQPELTINAATGDSNSSFPNGPESVNAGALATLTLGSGRFLQFSGTFTRGDKLAPEIGPQAFGILPLLTLVQIIPRNNYPIALCQAPPIQVADNPANQSDTTYGVGSNGKRLCGVPLNQNTSIDAGSYDPDSAELDTIKPIQLTSDFFSPILYAYQSLAQPWTVSNLTVTDAHGGINTCTAPVELVDETPPIWKADPTGTNWLKDPNVNTGSPSDLATLCIWPPNFKYYCWLDITNQDNDQIIPLYDNCGGSVDVGKQVDGFVCGDSDPRTVEGDCVLYKQGSQYNLCVYAQRRTVYTNTARVYQANFPVTDASQQDPSQAPIYSRQVRIPPLWQFQQAGGNYGGCPRPTYSNLTSVGTVFYQNPSKRKR